MLSHATSALVLIVALAGLGFQGVAPARSQPQGGGGGAEGATLFMSYCASCHGVRGTGSGPMAPVLRHEPPDLTQLSKNNGGMFPAARVHRIVEGRDVESHGDRDMPVWGDAFTTTREGRSQEAADRRIAAIVAYLSSIQYRDAH
jgi:mono/diheme cytochrome c family protein